MTQIRVKDIGPIADATVDLKPLTVFLGPNGVGKSYMALAVYCLARTLDQEMLFGGPWRGAIARERANGLKSITLELPKDEYLLRGPMRVGDIPAPMREAIVDANSLLSDMVTTRLVSELTRCFGVDVQGLIRRDNTSTRPALGLSITEPETGFLYDMQASGQNEPVSRMDNNLDDQTIELNRIAWGPLAHQRVSRRTPRRINEETLVLSSVVLLRLLERNLPQIPDVHYMPASRSGILLGHKTLTSMLVGQASRAWVEPIEIPRLPGVITDLIQAILLMDRIDSPPPQIEKVISFLEKRVARGHVHMKLDTDYPEVYYESANGQFQFHQVHSAVSEIAPIVLFLQHLVRPGDLFIMEEPEAHLDAENQRALASAIAMLVNAGVKLLITTHSDFFVNQLNNLLLLSQLSKRSRAGRRYLASEVLVPDNVSAYLFEESAEGSIARSLPVSAEGGIPLSPFTDVHSALYNEAVALEYAAE